MKTAYLLINCEFGSEEEVMSKLRTVSGVKDICGTFGAYDFVATVKGDSEVDLLKTVSEHIRTIPKIRSTLTLMTVEGQE